MNKIAHYLQEHLSGEILASSAVLNQFSTDASILTIKPTVVVFPRNENDVRKTARFTWQLAQRGRVFPITARGSGTDQTGAAIGSGIILVFPAHMNRILELDSKTGTVSVEAGINFGKLQQSLFTHDRYLPSFPASIEYSTIGGAIANNAGGDKSIKYGNMIEFVKGLRVVLANGDVIETHRLTKRELNRKLGLSTFEGEIYRTIDVLIEENLQLIQKISDNRATKNSSGYAIQKVKRKDGSFDLTPLFVGSQGTLGIITDAVIATVARHVNSSLISMNVDDVNVLEEIVLELRNLPELPSAIEVVDENLLKLVREHDPNLIKKVVKEPFPKFVLLVEFDNPSDHVQKRLSKRLIKLLKHYQVPYQLETDMHRKDELWKVRHSTIAVLSNEASGARPLPFIEDGAVPPDQLSKYITAVYELYAKNNLPVYIYGHAGDGHLHLQPLLDLKQVGDRQKIFKLMDEYYHLVIGLGGSISGENGDGRIRAPFLQTMYGDNVYELFKKIKLTFDPHLILNPGVKFGGSAEDLKGILREGYSLSHLYNYLPYM